MAFLYHSSVEGSPLSDMSLPGFDEQLVLRMIKDIYNDHQHFNQIYNIEGNKDLE